MEEPKRNIAYWLGYLTNKDIRVEHGQIELIEETITEKEAHWPRRLISFIALPVLLLVIIGWVIASTFLPKIRLGNEVIQAHQSDAALQNIIQKRASGYRLAFVYPDGSKKDFSLEDMGFKVDSKATLNSIRREQHQFASRVQWWHPTTAYLAVTTDNSRLNSFIAKNATVTIQPAKDATLSINNGSVQLTDGHEGKHYGLVEPRAALSSAVSNLRSNSIALQTLSTRPAISSKQLASSQAKIQNILNQDVTFTIDGKNIKATSADIAEWIELSSKDSGKAVDVNVNSGKVLAYINKVSVAYVRPPKAQITVVRSDGTSAVLVAGVNGTDVINKSDAAALVAENLLKGKGIQQNLTVKYASYKTITAQSYDKWIEVDTTNKRMYAYEQTSLAKTFLISAGAPGTPTVTGQFAIYSKYAQQDMRGQNVDGSSYFQPKVPWINYFYKDYAIHGNYWRPLSYFGNINSSHGCVGIVESDAQWIYSWAPIGTPVIVHT